MKINKDICNFREGGSSKQESYLKVSNALDQNLMIKEEN
jgi:hypothetical protein